MPYQIHPHTGVVTNKLPDAYGINDTWRGYGTLGGTARKAMLAQRRKDQIARKGVGIAMHPEERIWQNKGLKEGSKESLRRLYQMAKPITKVL